MNRWLEEPPKQVTVKDIMRLARDDAATHTIVNWWQNGGGTWEQAMQMLAYHQTNEAARLREALLKYQRLDSSVVMPGERSE